MSSHKHDPLSPPADAVWLVPLGGSGEIGMNFNLYGTAGKWLIVDCGVCFPDETMPGIEVIMPDVSFIAERKQDLIGMVITHGHEDHIGAIEYLWPQLQCPVYATQFTAELIRSKLGRKDKKSNARVIELPQGGGFELGPFQVDLLHVTHSVPEAQMISITTKHGKILHTGDWKFDPHPVIGNLTDMDALKALGKQNIMALVGDSTNAIVSGHSGSELDVQNCLKKVFKRYKNRIAVTCFASNIARLKSIAVAATECGRKVGLVGVSLWRYGEIAEMCGYLPEFKHFLDEEQVMSTPRSDIVMVCTGCQGELRAAMARIAAGEHPDVQLEKDDVVIFSSREIPGNEKPIARVQNLLLEQGIQILTTDSEPVHVSGHPAQDELRELYQTVKPKLSVAVHGELRHQTEHQRIAKECGVKQTIIPTNGQIIKLGPGYPEIVGEVPVGRLGMDGKILRPLNGDAVKFRRKMGYNGAVVIALALDRRGEVATDPQIAVLGLEESANIEELRDDLCEAVMDATDRLTKATLIDDAAVKNAVAQTVRRLMDERYGKKPLVEVNLMRV